MLGSSACPPESGRCIHRYQFFHSRREYRSASNRFEELPHAAEFFVPLFEQRAGSEREQIPKRAIENRVQKRSGTLVVQVRSSFRFGNNFIDDAELAQIARRDLERFRGHFRFCRIAPQNRRATLRGNYGIHRILQHVHAVPTAIASAPPEPPSPVIVTTMG